MSESLVHLPPLTPMFQCALLTDKMKQRRDAVLKNEFILWSLVPLHLLFSLQLEVWDLLLLLLTSVLHHLYLTAMNSRTLESSTGSDADWVFLYYDHLSSVLEEPGHHVTDQLDSKQTLVTLILHFQKEDSHNLC